MYSVNYKNNKFTPFTVGYKSATIVPVYRPDIEYKWVTTINELNNTKQIVNAGAINPSYNADLYFGKGVKFNGTDQRVVTTNNLLTDGDDFTLITTFTYNGSNSRYAIGNYWTQNSIGVHVTGKICGVINTYRSNVAGVILQSNVVAEVGKTYTVVFEVESEKSAKIYINGELDTTVELTTGDITRSLNGVWYIGTGGNNSGRSDFLVQNSIIKKGTLQPHEILYQYTNPEKFLYHEKQADGTFIAKSEILSQEQIDNVVAHFPMCETDGYVRNMVGYSETQVNVNTGENGFTNTDGFHAIVASMKLNGSSIRITDNNDNTNSPRVVLNQQLKPNTSYRVKYDVLVDESVQSFSYIQVKYSADYYNNGGYTCVNGGLAASKGELVFTTDSNTDNQYCGITVGYGGDIAANGAFFDLNLFTVQELTSTYPIENFTASCRDGAKNLQTGLQTCFWKRDVLGVPVGSSFDELILSNDSTKGLTTGYIIDDANSFGIEAILEVFSPRRYNYFNLHPYYFCTHSAIDVYLRLNDVNYGENTGVGKQHCYMYYDAISSELTIAVNGIVKKTGTVTKYGVYGELETTYTNDGGKLPLLNIHTTPQDPAKLYADAVKKGLLS